MKTSEFIKQFNEAGRPDYSAERKDNGDDLNLVINHVDYRGESMKSACLVKGQKYWEWEIRGGLFNPKMLELMAEIALTPPEDREDAQQKYVILNGLPHRGTCSYFLIDAYSGRLLPSHLDGLDESNVAAMGTYSREGLREAKRGLTPGLATAVDLMTVTLERAIALTEQSKHDDLD